MPAGYLTDDEADSDDASSLPPSPAGPSASASALPRKGLVVGQAPGTSGEAFARGTTTVRRLATLCGVSCSDDLNELFDFVNLLDSYPGRSASGVGDAFDLKAARAAASGIPLVSRPVVLLLGSNVARAFGLPNNVLQWQGNILVLPHPSGINHFWNEPAGVALASAQVRKALVGAGLRSGSGQTATPV
eukprot:Rhum_TRINITY_DN8517_c0_g1::Rhum_TRINITY_DN8517_c0_g1_i1::g.28473::m.28473